MAAKRIIRSDDRLFKGNVLAVAALADQINGGICGNARDPCVKVVLLIVLLPGKLIETRERFEQGVLANVFGVGRITGHAQGAPIQSRRVGHNHFGEGLGVTGAGVGEGAALAGSKSPCALSGLKVVPVEDCACGGHDTGKIGTHNAKQATQQVIENKEVVLILKKYDRPETVRLWDES